MREFRPIDDIKMIPNPADDPLHIPVTAVDFTFMPIFLPEPPLLEVGQQARIENMLPEGTIEGTISAVVSREGEFTITMCDIKVLPKEKP